MSETFWFVFTLVVFGIIAVFAWWLPKYLQRRREASWPTTWIHEGDLPPPEGADKALQVLVDNNPGKRVGGWIVWHNEPYMLDGRLVAGHTSGVSPRFHVVKFLLMEKTATAHEIGHFWNEGDEETTTTPWFKAWVDKMNSLIATALGR